MLRPLSGSVYQVGALHAAEMGGITSASTIGKGSWKVVLLNRNKGRRESMRSLAKISVIALAITAFCACGSSPDSARRELGSMGIKYSQEGLRDAVRNQDKFAVELFIAAGINLNPRGNQQVPALQIAIEVEDDEIALMLLEAGAKPNAGAMNGALGQGNWSMVEMLLQAGFEPTSEGLGPFWQALSETEAENLGIDPEDITLADVFSSEFAQEMVTLFSRHGDSELQQGLFDIGIGLLKDMDDEGELGTLWLEIARDEGGKPTREQFVEAVKGGYLEAAELLISAGIKPGRQALIEASERWNPELVELLLDNGASPNTDVMVAAAKAGYVENMELLIAAADGSPGRRVLTAAVEGGSIEMMEMLLEEGVRPGNQALEVVITRSNASAARLASIQDRFPSQVEGLEDSMLDDLEVLELLLAEGTRPGSGTLDMAIEGGSLDLAKLLLDAGAKPSATVMEHAIGYEDIELVELLLDAGARASEAALQRAIQLGDEDLVEMIQGARTG